MTASQRIETALRRGIPDRVPFVPKIWVDFGARWLGVEIERVIQDPCTALEVILRTGVDFGLDGVRQFAFPARHTAWRDGRLFELTAAGRRIGPIDLDGGLQTQLSDVSDFGLSDPVAMTYFHYRHAPLPVLNRMADVRAIAVPEPPLLDELGFNRNQKEVCKRVETSCAGRAMPALIQDCGPIGMAFYVAFNGMNKALLDLFDQPRLVHAALDRGDRIAVARGTYWLNQGYRILRINDSAGNMSVLSPQHWRSFIKPHFTAVAAELHRACPDALLYCHICGNVLPILDDLVDTGLDCIGPLDPLGGMSVAESASVVAGRTALMGGINTLSFVNSDPMDVQREALACIQGARAAAGCEAVPPGFVLGSGCVMPRDASPPNIRAAAEAVVRKT
ncbi:MAG: hypothetical protein EA384_16140 [Spirochaetaceae bacterium]|nr:MAG: hypothetical protein EA384_16140 [Spirochaetaceae bacterium]